MTAVATLPARLGRFVAEVPSLPLRGRFDRLRGVGIEQLAGADAAATWRANLDRIGLPARLDPGPGLGLATIEDPTGGETRVLAGIPAPGGLLLLSAAALPGPAVEALPAQLAAVAAALAPGEEVPPDGFALEDGAVALPPDGTPEALRAYWVDAEDAMRLAIGMETVAEPRSDAGRPTLEQGLAALARAGIAAEVLRAGPRDAAGQAGEEEVLRLVKGDTARVLASWRCPGAGGHDALAPAIEVELEGDGEAPVLAAFDHILATLRPR